MADLICRNTMMRCQTPGMCSPFGGCQPSVLKECDVRCGDSSVEHKRLQSLSCAVNSAMHAAGIPADADPAELADVIHRLQVQVATLQSNPNSWQSGYDKGRADGARARLSELEQERQINAELRAEVEALRKDAERYRWLRSAENDVAITFGIHAWEDLSDEFMDAAIDAAMGKDAGGHSTENQAETLENTGREAGRQGEVR